MLKHLTLSNLCARDNKARQPTKSVSIMLDTTTSVVSKEFNSPEFFDCGPKANPIGDAFASRFVYCKDIELMYRLMLGGNKSGIFHGLAGHNKSAFTLTALEAFGVDMKDVAIINCGSGMTEDKLLGGLDIARYEADKVIVYNLDNSFMRFKYVVFEEMFQAPLDVLLTLKDIMTSGQYRSVSQTYECQTQVYIVNTNSDPSKLAKKSPDIAALMERFHYHHEVKWPDYTAQSYLTLLDMRRKFMTMGRPSLAEMEDSICRLFVKLNNHTFISPRTAIRAYEMLQDQSMILGRQMMFDDLKLLRFLPDCEKVFEMAWDEFITEVNLDESSVEFRRIKSESETLVAYLASKKYQFNFEELSNQCSAVKALQDSLHATIVVESYRSAKLRLIFTLSQANQKLIENSLGNS
jgi:MoxR-like ATPase